jgi:adenylate cyclase
MFHFRQPTSAVLCALELASALPAAGLPQVHAGVAAGPVIERDGDYVGRTVNLASRLADTAEADQVLVNGAAATEATELAFDRLGTIELRGLGRQDAFKARRA